MAQPSAPDGPARRPVLVAVLIVLAALLAAVGLLVGVRLGASPPLPASDSVDAGFARDMRDHHSQAVQLSSLVRDRTSDEDVRTLAYDVMTTQQHQAGQMSGWLAAWGLPQADGAPRMAWMGASADGGADAMQHAMGGAAGEATGGGAAGATVGGPLGGMPGAASEEDVQRLTDATGRDAERLYLQLLIPHHEGGVAMAEVAAREASQPATRSLARVIVSSQRAEVAVLERMLAERGGPLP